MINLKSFEDFVNESRQHWDEDSVRKEASKYKTKKEFHINCSGGYKYAKTHNLLDVLFGESKHWDEESVKEEAKKYNSKQEFRIGNPPAYAYAKHHNILDDLFNNLRQYWDEESVREEAKKYSSKVEFKKGNSGAYSWAVKHNIIDDIFGKTFFWTEELVQKEAAKYDTKTEFHKNSPSAYNYALKHHMLNDFDWLLTNDNIKRCIYVYVDEDNKVAYVGLTSNKKQRHATHKTGMFGHRKCESQVFKYFTFIHKDVPEPIYLDDNIDNAIEAQEKEDYWKKKYEEDGYFMLNKGKTGIGVGSLGSILKWNDITVSAEASKYSSKGEFSLYSNGAYHYARKHHMLDELFPGSTYKYWDKNSVKEEAEKYSSKVEFQKECPGAYHYAVRNNILDDLFGKSIHWDDESVRNEAEKYSSKNEFKKECPGAYHYTYRHHMLDELFPKDEKSED